MTFLFAVAWFGCLGWIAWKAAHLIEPWTDRVLGPVRVVDGPSLRSACADGRGETDHDVQDWRRGVTPQEQAEVKEIVDAIRDLRSAKAALKDWERERTERLNAVIRGWRALAGALDKGFMTEVDRNPEKQETLLAEAHRRIAESLI